MRKMIILLFITIFGLSSQNNLNARNKQVPEASSSLNNIEKGFQEIHKKDSSGVVQIMNSKNGYEIALYNYYKGSVEHRKNVYEFQFWTSKFLFWMTFVSIFISFIASMYHLFKGHNDTSTTFKLGKDGIEFSSSLVGIILLIISFSFLFLYLKEVYPINQTRLDSDTIKVTSEK